MRHALVLSLLTAALLAGCAADDPAGADGDGGQNNQTTTPVASPPPAAALSVATSGTYPVNPGFAPATLAAESGAEVTVTLANEDANAATVHDWVLDGVEGAATEAIGSGETASVTFTAPAPGDYVYFCSIGDHRARGMEGTLRVA